MVKRGGLESCLRPKFFNHLGDMDLSACRGPSMMRQVLPPPRRVHVVLAKLSGATMWCWILWRLKHDWRDVFVSCTPVGRGGDHTKTLVLQWGGGDHTKTLVLQWGGGDHTKTLVLLWGRG